MPYFDVRKLVLLALGICLGAHPPATLAAPKAPAARTAPANAATAKVLPSDPANRAPLDTSAVRKLYLEGEFEEAIGKLEASLRSGSGFSHRDSVFLFKHLGVMYAARYETREKGKHYMHKLLEVEPTARILDMYASDMIYMIFKNIQDEFNAGRPVRLTDQGPVPQPQPARRDSARPARKERSFAWLGWTAGAVAAAGGLALGIHLLEEKAGPARKENISHD
jgi:hypothetical protein